MVNILTMQSFEKMSHFYETLLCFNKSGLASSTFKFSFIECFEQIMTKHRQEIRHEFWLKSKLSTVLLFYRNIAWCERKEENVTKDNFLEENKNTSEGKTFISI